MCSSSLQLEENILQDGHEEWTVRSGPWSHVRQIKRFLLGTTLTDDVMARTIEKYDENVDSKRCGRATFTECVPLPPEARGTAGPHQTYNSWRARSCFEHTKQAKVGGQSAGPKACLALLAERKQQRMLSRRRERPPFKRFVCLALRSTRRDSETALETRKLSQ